MKVYTTVRDVDGIVAEYVVCQACLDSGDEVEGAFVDMWEQGDECEFCGEEAGDESVSDAE